MNLRNRLGISPDAVARSWRLDANALDGLGSQIRELRRSRRMTVRDLAAAIDRSAGYISQIERDISKPSLKDLYNLANALGVPVGWFLERRDAGDASEHGLIVRAGNRRWMESSGIRTEVLSPRLGEKVEFYLSTFAPGARTEPTFTRHPGIESALIMAGLLRMWIDGESHLLKAGDSYSVRLEQEYWSINPSTEEDTVLVWTVTYTR